MALVWAICGFASRLRRNALSEILWFSRHKVTGKRAVSQVSCVLQGLFTSESADGGGLPSVEGRGDARPNECADGVRRWSLKQLALLDPSD